MVQCTPRLPCGSSALACGWDIAFRRVSLLVVCVVRIALEETASVDSLLLGKHDQLTAGHCPHWTVETFVHYTVLRHVAKQASLHAS